MRVFAKINYFRYTLIHDPNKIISTICQGLYELGVEGVSLEGDKNDLTEMGMYVC